MRPRLDLAVVTWNTSHLTVAALRRTLESAKGFDVRVLVHDNASSDDTVEALASRVPEAEVEASDENLGFARAMNLLIARSSAPWFLALNSDAWAEETALSTMVAAAERHPRAAAVAPLLVRPDGTPEASTHPFPSLRTAMIDVLGGRRWMPRGYLEDLCLEGAWRQDRPRCVDWAVGAALLMRRDALEELGGFDERFFMYAEDLEWCWRACRAGWHIRFEPAARVRHVGNASGEKRWGQRRVALEAANLRVLLPEMMGSRKAVLHSWLQAAACSERMLLAGASRRREEARDWRLKMRAHLGLEKMPALDSTRGAPALETG